MEAMSDGEMIIMIGAMACSAIAQVWIWVAIGSRPVYVATGVAQWVLGPAPLVVAGVTLLSLLEWSSFDVRSDPRYLTMYTALGVAWTIGVATILDRTRLSWRDDVLERNNGAAGAAFAGAVAGAAATYIGGNVGDGPGWWVVFAASGTAALLWLLVLELLHRFTGCFDKVTLDRDLGAGIRLGGFALAAGIICGRGAAGDWYSLERMFDEFVVAWPVLPLLGIGLVIELGLGTAPPAGQRRAISTLIAAVYVGFATGAVMLSPALVEYPFHDASH